MCKAIRDMLEEKFEEGISQGILTTLDGLVRDGILKAEEAAVRAGMPTEEFCEKVKELIVQ